MYNPPEKSSFKKERRKIVKTVNLFECTILLRRVPSKRKGEKL
jgi:hypothetical protein